MQCGPQPAPLPGRQRPPENLCDSANQALLTGNSACSQENPASRKRTTMAQRAAPRVQHTPPGSKNTAAPDCRAVAAAASSVAAGSSSKAKPLTKSASVFCSMRATPSGSWCSPTNDSSGQGPKSYRLQGEHRSRHVSAAVLQSLAAPSHCQPHAERCLLHSKTAASR